MNESESASQPTKRGANFAKNSRPASSKRVTFALGAEGQEQADRLARVLSTSRKGGVSQSAVIRGLLKLAETAALNSGDPVVKTVFESDDNSSLSRKIRKANPDSARIWEAIRSVILEP